MLSLVSPCYDEDMTDTLVTRQWTWPQDARFFYRWGEDRQLGGIQRVQHRAWCSKPPAQPSVRTGMHVKLAFGWEGMLARLIGGQLKVATVRHGKQPQHKYRAAVLSRRSEVPDDHRAVWSFSTMVDVVVRLPAACPLLLFPDDVLMPHTGAC